MSEPGRLESPLLDASRRATHDVPEHARHRVWARLSQQRPRSLPRWVVPATAALVLLVGAGLALRGRPGRLPGPAAAMVYLVRGEASVATAAGRRPLAVGEPLALPAQLTAPRGVALRDGPVAMLLSGEARLDVERTRLDVGELAAVIEGRGLSVQAGDVEVSAQSAVLAVSVASAQATSVVVYRGTATVRRAGRTVELRAGQRWRPDAPVAPAQDGAPAELALLDALSPEPRGGERAWPPLLDSSVQAAAVAVRGDADVELDGVGLGRAPLAFRTTPGAHQLNGQAVTVGAAGLTLELREPYAEGQEQSDAGNLEAAARSFAKAALGKDARAQAALYELGRLRQRQGQPEAGLAAFDEYLRRWPDGLLAQEAALSALDALVTLEEEPQALERARAFLLRWPDSERRAEVRALVHRLGGGE